MNKLIICISILFVQRLAFSQENYNASKPDFSVCNLHAIEKINTFKVFSVDGSVVNNGWSMTNESEINVSALSNGIYYISALADSGNQYLGRITVIK